MLATRHHGSIRRIYLARHDGLQFQDGASRHDDRIDRDVRL
jgi:hypothetical protein